MSLLTKKQAQNIVDKMMKVIPYNVNIMDESGVIVGSGDVNRVNQIHDGAVQALKERAMVEIYEDKGGAKPGVNTPIFFDAHIVGVIGITGNPDEVRPFVELVSVTAELLINQEHVLNQKKISEQLREEFLYEWAYRKERYSKTFIERGLSIGIDVTIQRYAVIFTFNEKDFEKIEKRMVNTLKNDEFYIKLNPETVLAFINYDKQIIKRLEIFLNFELSESINIGIGTNEDIIYISVQNAINAVNVGKKLDKGSRIHEYKDLAFVSTLIQNFNNNEILGIINKLECEGKSSELVETLIAYINMNGEVKATADKIHVHRNTLNYRLEKIYEITNKNPKKLIDLFELFTSYIVWSLKDN